MISSPWGHDYAWERAIVRRLRAGGRAPEVYALYEDAISHETGERAGLLTGVVYYDAKEAEERALKNQEFRDSLRAAQEAAKIRNAKEAEERKARQAEYRAKRAERAKQEAERAAAHVRLEQETRQRFEDYHRNRPIEIAERIEHARQEARIMASKWVCTVCSGKSFIERKNPGYQITCLNCGKSAWGSHKSLWEVLSK